MLLVDLIIANDKAANRGECKWKLARQGFAMVTAQGTSDHLHWKISQA